MAASHLLNNASARAILSSRGRQRVESAHTYDHRVARLLPWVKDVFGLGDTGNSSSSNSYDANVGESSSSASSASTDNSTSCSSSGSSSRSGSSSYSLVDFPADPVQRPNTPSILLLYELPNNPNPNPNLNTKHGTFSQGWDLPLHFGWLPTLARLEHAGLYRVVLRGVAPQDWVNGSFLGPGASKDDGGTRDGGSRGDGRESGSGSGEGEGSNEEPALLLFEGHALILLRAPPTHPAACALADAARRHPPFVYQATTAAADATDAASSSSRSAPQWQARSAVGLLVPRGSSVASSGSAAAREVFDSFDLVAEDGVDVDAVSTDSNGEGKQSEDHAFTWPHNQHHRLRFLSIDVGAVRERSQGWDDQIYTTTSSSSSPKWDHAAVVESELDLTRAAARLCDPNFGSTRRAVFVVGTIPKSALIDADHHGSSDNDSRSSGGNSEVNAAATMSELRSCGVHMVNMPRPEMLPGLLRTTSSVEVLANQATVLLAALAAGTRATVGKEEDDNTSVNGNRQCNKHNGSNNGLGYVDFNGECEDAGMGDGQTKAYPSLTALLASEIAKAASGKPPLAQFDVPPQCLESTAANDDPIPSAAAADQLSLPPPALKLLASLNAAAFGVRAAASIIFVHPSGPNATISRGACLEAVAAAGRGGGDSGARIGVRVAVSGFRAPADGVWCLRVDSSEVACFGDHTFDAEVCRASCSVLAFPPQPCIVLVYLCTWLLIFL